MFLFVKLSESKNAVRVTGAILFTGLLYFATASLPLSRAQAQTDQVPANVSQRGELVYVPIYSSIFYENGKHTLELAATLSIHNVNPDRQITILRADYYDTAGRLIKKYVDKPLVLNGLQTTNVVIEKANTIGGTGANFLVEWQSKQDVTSPLIEAVMVNASSNLGIAFTTTGKVVRQSVPTAK